MKKILFIIIKIIKKNLDKVYYSLYTHEREALTRKMFPGINGIGEYKFIDIYMKNHNSHDIDELYKVIYSFYRGEVNRYILEGKTDSINTLQGLMDFIYSIKAYQEELLIIQK